MQESEMANDYEVDKVGAGETFAQTQSLFSEEVDRKKREEEDEKDLKISVCFDSEID